MIQTQQELERLRTLQESFHDLDDKINVVLPALADKIDNIQLPKIDTTELAKQGDDQDATNSKILNEVRDTISKVADEVLKRVTVQISYDGNVSNDGYPLNSVLSVLANKSQITTLYDNSITQINFGLIAGNNTTLPLKTLGLTGVNRLRMDAISVFMNASEVCSVNGGEVIIADFPNLETFNSYVGRNFQSSRLEELYVPKLRILDGLNVGNTFQSSINLIKIVIGGNFKSSFNFQKWSPTNAMNQDSTSLIKQGESFASNADKFHYNLREFIANNLPDRKAEIDAGGTAYTITFATELGEFISSNEETYNAFTDKGWVIAY